MRHAMKHAIGGLIYSFVVSLSLAGPGAYAQVQSDDGDMNRMYPIFEDDSVDTSYWYDDFDVMSLPPPRGGQPGRPPGGGARPPSRPGNPGRPPGGGHPGRPSNPGRPPGGGHGHPNPGHPGHPNPGHPGHPNPGHPGHPNPGHPGHPNPGHPGHPPGHVPHPGHGNGHDGRFHGGHWYPHPGWRGGWHHNPYWYPSWYYVGIRFPAWYWIPVPQGFWQCTAFNQYMDAYPAYGPTADEAAYGALYNCGGTNYQAAGCYIPQGYCQFRN